MTVMEDVVVRLNIGSGDLPMRLAGWTNVDETPYAGVDRVLHVPPLPWPDAGVREIYAGHFLEHLDLDEGHTFLIECYRTLEPGGLLGILVPDMAEIFRRYVLDEPAPMEFPSRRNRSTTRRHRPESRCSRQRA